MFIRDTKHRPAGLAIAALLLLSTSPLAAQEVEPVPAEPAVTSTPVTTTETPVAEPVTTTAEPVSEPAAESTEAAAPATAATTTRSRATARSTASSTAARAAPAVAAPVAAAPAPAEEPVLAAEAAPPLPIAAEPLPVAEPEPVGNAVNDDVMVAGAAGAGLLALAGLGFALYRRRRHEEDDYVFNEEPALVHEPTPAPIVREPDPVLATKPAPMPERMKLPMQSASAFSWGNSITPRAQPDRRRESMTEAAMRGPTPDNPSLSLKKRLKRAAFFEQRERLVRAGKADRIETQAGLPDAATERTQPARWVSPARVRELQPA